MLCNMRRCDQYTIPALVFHLLIYFLCDVTHGVTTQNLVVEGFDGGAVTLPCTLTGEGTLEWRSGEDTQILLKPKDKAVIIGEGPYEDVVSLVGGTDLRISSLDKKRDDETGGRIFLCRYLQGSAEQQARVRVLARITGARIDEASGGTITVTEGVPKTLTCTVMGNPNPPPFYSWRVDGSVVSGQGGAYSLTADRSTSNTTCTATNRYSNGTELSHKEGTATLNVLYLGLPSANTPVTVMEGDSATLRCSAEGNPQPSYRWIRSGSPEVISRSADYTVVNVERSAAGKYTCNATNSAGNHQSPFIILTVQYPPDPMLTYDKPTQTLTCTADGVPANYSFSPWEHRLGGKLLQTLGTGSSQSQATLKLPDTLTYEDMGYYVCQVSNGIKGTHRKELYVRPETAAVFPPHSSEVYLNAGATGRISVPFYTHSETPDVRVAWRRSGENTVLPSHQEAAGFVSLTIRGQDVSIEGTVTVLTLTDVTQADGGNYTVTVTNDIDGVPLSRQKAVSVSVRLTGGFTKGIRPGGSEGQEQGTQNTGSTPIGPIAGGAGGALALILIVVIIIVFIRRRRSPAPKSKDYEEKAESAKGAPGTDLTKARVTDPRWNHPGAELVDNDLYQSAGEAGAVPSKDQAKKFGKPASDVAGKKGKRPKKPKDIMTPETTSPADNDSTGQGNPPTGHDQSKKTSKKSGLTYTEVEFTKGSDKPTIHPRADPVTYASIGNLGAKPVAVAKPLPQSAGTSEYELEGLPEGANNTPAEKPNLTYAEVEFSKGSGKPTIHPRDAPVTYASIGNLK